MKPKTIPAFRLGAEGKSTSTCLPPIANEPWLSDETVCGTAPVTLNACVLSLAGGSVFVQLRALRVAAPAAPGAHSDAAGTQAASPTRSRRRGR